MKCVGYAGVSMTTPASASAPAAFRSALKTGGSASKRVSWDPSVAGKALQVRSHGVLNAEEG